MRSRRQSVSHLAGRGVARAHRSPAAPPHQYSGRWLIICLRSYFLESIEVFLDALAYLVLTHVSNSQTDRLTAFSMAGACMLHFYLLTQSLFAIKHSKHGHYGKASQKVMQFTYM